MSILLDSLKQKIEKDEYTVPTVHDSHFDDEMLNDDALISSNRFWKLVSTVLFIVLSISWIYFYLENLNSNELPISLNTALKKGQSVSENTHNKSEQNTAELDSNTELNPQFNNNISEEKNNLEVVQYKPQKRNIQSKKTNTSEKNIYQIEGSNKLVNETKINKSFYSTSDAIDYDELSTEILMELPSLDVASYAVSNNPQKSFIVLSGSFYSIGETIAPNLKLLSIDKKSVIFRYGDILIKKKYK